jgi:hypothetical protein
MEYRYFPGKLRFRDHVLRDEDIRNSAIEVVHIICPSAKIDYIEKTSGILATFNPESLDVEKLKTFLPMLMEIEPKVRFFTPKKKNAILEGIEQIKNKAKDLFNY